MQAACHRVDNGCLAATAPTAATARAAAVAAAMAAATTKTTAGGGSQLEQLLFLGSQQDGTAAAAGDGSGIAGEKPLASSLQEKLLRQRRMRLRIPCGGSAAPFAAGSAFTFCRSRPSVSSVTSTLVSDKASKSCYVCSDVDAAQPGITAARHVGDTKPVIASHTSGALVKKESSTQIAPTAAGAVENDISVHERSREKKRQQQAEKSAHCEVSPKSDGKGVEQDEVVTNGIAAADAEAGTQLVAEREKDGATTGGNKIVKRGEAKTVRFAADVASTPSSSSKNAEAKPARLKRNGITGEEGRRVTAVKDKWRLLPAYLAAKGLVHQHIESYNYFVKKELLEILRAPSNRLVKSDVDPSFFIEFLNIYAGSPRYYEEGMIVQRLTPHICRTRELTYAAPLFVDAEYSRGEEIIRRRKVEIGLLPVMLKSDLCVLHGKDVAALQRLGECPYDPGGYFVVRGTEKVRLHNFSLNNQMPLYIRKRIFRQTFACV